MQILRGNIYYANLGVGIGSEQGGKRPVMVVQNNIGNKYSTTVIVAPLTNNCNSKSKLPTHIKIEAGNGIKYDSILLLEQIRVIDKKRLEKFITHISIDKINKINSALAKAVGIKNRREYE